MCRLFIKFKKDIRGGKVYDENKFREKIIQLVM